VLHEEVAYQAARPGEAAAPPNWVLQYFIVGAFVGMAIALPAWRRWTRTARITAGIYAGVIGFAGCFGLWAWFFTAHWAAWRNENLFEYSPLALPLVVLILMMRQRPRARRAAVYLAFAVAASTLLGLLLSSLLPQKIAEPMALVLPANLALAAALWKLSINNQQSTVP
jgi:hypothetical protein